MRRIPGCCIILVLLTIIFQGNIYSQTMQSEIKSLSKDADVILTGKVIRQKSSWNGDKSRIFTNVVVQADEYLKGEHSGNTISLVTPGGEVDGVGELYSHMPEFKNDEEVLLFLKKDKKTNQYKVSGGEEGKLTLYKNKNGETVTSSNTKISFLKEQIKNLVKTD